MLVHRAVAEGHRIAQHEDPKRARPLRKIVVAWIAQPQAVDVHRHAGEPPVVIRGEPLAAHRIGEEESRPPSSRLPCGAHPDLDGGGRGQHREKRGRHAHGDERSPPAAQSHPRCQYAKIAMYSKTTEYTCSSDAPRA